MVVLAIICLSWLACASDLDRGGMWSPFFGVMALGSWILLPASFRPRVRGRPLQSWWRVLVHVTLPLVTLLLIWSAVPLQLRLLANQAELEAFAATSNPDERLPARIGSFSVVAAESGDGGIYLHGEPAGLDRACGLFFRADGQTPGDCRWLVTRLHDGWWWFRM